MREYWLREAFYSCTKRDYFKLSHWVTNKKALFAFYFFKVLVNHSIFLIKNSSWGNIYFNKIFRQQPKYKHLHIFLTKKAFNSPSCQKNFCPVVFYSFRVLYAKRGAVTKTQRDTVPRNDVVSARRVPTKVSCLLENIKIAERPSLVLNLLWRCS